MPYVIYNLDRAIAKFFTDAGTSLSRAECDEIARARCGGQVKPVDIQGSNSYTVIAGPHKNKIIQFREQAALLDTKVVKLARDTHGDIIPSCQEVGPVGDLNGSQLIMYEMERLRGQNCVIARLSLASEHRLNIAIGLAKFFAQAWEKKVTDPTVVDVPAVRAQYHARIEYLARSLPERFLPAITEVQAALPLFFGGHYPLVLTHADLNEMNILIDPDDGKITGIIDWSSAVIQPFGFALYALENALGIMNDEGWRYYENADDLRGAFWETFKQFAEVPEAELSLTRLAAKAGILIRYGTAYDSGFSGLVGVRDPNCDDFRYLDALLL